MAKTAPKNPVKAGIKKVQDSLNFKGKNNPLVKGKSEVSFQMSLERYQIAVESGKFSETALTKRAQKAIDSVVTNEINLRKAGIKNPVSNYDQLLHLYNSELRHVRLEDLTAKAEGEIERFLGKTTGVVTEEQKEIIVKYFHGKQKQEYAVITDIKGILSRKGKLTGNEAVNIELSDKMKERMLLTEQELAEKNA